MLFVNYLYKIKKSVNNFLSLLLGPGKIPSRFLLSLTIYIHPHNDLTHPTHSHIFHIHHHNDLLYSTHNHIFRIHPHDDLIRYINRHLFLFAPSWWLDTRTLAYTHDFSRNPIHTLTFFLTELKRKKWLFPIPNNLP